MHRPAHLPSLTASLQALCAGLLLATAGAASAEEDELFWRPMGPPVELPAPAGQADAPGAAAAAPADPSHPRNWGLWAGEAAFHMSYSGGRAMTRRASGEVDLQLLRQRHESSLEASFDRETLRADGLGPQLSVERWDINYTYRYFFDEQRRRRFVYLSPRLRHNAFGYYVDTQALRLGVGQRWQPVDRLDMTLATGVGAREAQVYDGGRLHEPLWTLAARGRWKATEQLSLRLDLVHERGPHETYQTLAFVARTQLSRHFGFQLKASYNRNYPFNSQEREPAVNLDLGLSYEL